MSSGRKCKNCGSSDIEVDPARGDAVCTNCGVVLEDNIIVAEVEFQENAHGSASAIGQFVSAESKGGATGFGASFHMGIGAESRELTLRKAKQGITALCQQLRLNQHCIDIACNFFKMALNRQLTKGRPTSHIHAACVYITCRTEGTAHLLIDISDVLQISCFQLGRTYLRLSQALCISIPSIDPCLYILRFANKLAFNEKTHDVSMTALRLVQRMKRDSIHSGRRPSGLCGAALLIAARLHEFHRTPIDIIRVVKVHESTLRKRLLEFGETPSSALTLDEFLTVDLEEEQDPPAFKAARKRDKERLQKLVDEEGENVFTMLQKEIETQLDGDSQKRKFGSYSNKLKDDDELEREALDIDQFTLESTLGVLEDAFVNDSEIAETVEIAEGLGPDFASMGLFGDTNTSTTTPITEDTNPMMAVNPTAAQQPEPNKTESNEISLDNLEEDDIDSYIMTPAEINYKAKLWTKINSGYLKDQKIKAERLAKEKEEGKPEKKKRKATGKKKGGAIGPSASAGEAIEKMLQEKKFSNKINYDILKSLNMSGNREEEKVIELAEVPAPSPAPVEPAAKKRKETPSTQQPIILSSPVQTKRRNKKAAEVLPLGLPIAESPQTPAPPETPKQAEKVHEDEESEYYEEDADVPEVQETNEMESISQMLRSQEDDQEYYGFDDY